MPEALISVPLRSPIGREAGALRALLPEQFGAQVLAAVMRQGGLPPHSVEDVIIGNQFVPARIARHCAVLAGLPVEVPGMTVSRGCASGLEAVVRAAHSIRSGASKVLIAGGVESYTRAPYLLDKPSEPYQRKPPQFVSAETRDEIGDPEIGLATPMGTTAELVAEAYGVSREDQDEFAAESQRRAARAVEEGLFANEKVPIEVPERRGGTRIFDVDECPRPDTTAEVLARLKPLFKESGSVTAGNACKRADGAAMMVASSEQAAESLALRPCGRLVAAATVGVPPKLMGIGPVPAVKLVLDKAKLTLDDIAVIELNEAFASQALAVIRELRLDQERVNPNGGAIAFGHPTGATGAALVGKLLRDLERRDERFGIVTMCIGSGMGSAAVFERVRT